jgi:MarR family protein
LLRVHFTPEDFARVRVRDEPHPLWEVLLSLHLLQTQQGAVEFDSWRRFARTTPRPLLRMLTTLARPKGYSPDFLTPAVDSPDLETGLDVLLSTPKSRLHNDISVLTAQTLLPAWVSDVAAGDVRTLRHLTEGIRQYHKAVLAPHWSTIRAHVRASRAQRAESTMSGGLEGMLLPGMRLRGTVMEVPYPVDQDLYLNGRGLTLVPSFFCWQTAITVVDAHCDPVLVYPVERRLDWDLPPRPQALVALLGRTRAAVLLTIAERPHLNTTELARALGTSPASASQHATVLREAGLVVTHRHNGAALHTLSPRGRDLLARPYLEQPA